MNINIYRFKRNSDIKYTRSKFSDHHRPFAGFFYSSHSSSALYKSTVYVKDLHISIWSCILWFRNITVNTNTIQFVFNFNHTRSKLSAVYRIDSRNQFRITGSFQHNFRISDICNCYFRMRKCYFINNIRNSISLAFISFQKLHSGRYIIEQVSYYKSCTLWTTRIIKRNLFTTRYHVSGADIFHIRFCNKLKS